MTVVFRWIFLSTLSRVAAITVAVVLIFMVAESIDKARFLGNGLTVQLLLEFLVLKIPFMISELMPVVVLIGVAIYVLELSHNHELAALRAAGVTFTTLLKPLLAAGAVIGLLMFAVGEWVEPLVNQKLSYIQRVHIDKEKPLNQGVQWLHENNNFMRLTPLTNGYFSVLMVKRDDAGLWVERVDANKGRYVQGQWHLEHAYISKPEQNNGFSTQYLKSMVVPSSLNPTTVAAPDPRDMQWLELYEFEQALAEAGLESNGYLFQLQRKISTPISCLIMVILAYSLCAGMGERLGARSKGLMLAITFGLLYHVVGSAIEVYVTGGQIPVIYAVWFPNMLFFGLAGYLLLKKEGY